MSEFLRIQLRREPREPVVAAILLRAAYLQYTQWSKSVSIFDFAANGPFGESGFCPPNR
jgi:hypothetical protein